MLDFRVETFIAVCETMNYTKAAEQLGITQPAVSQHIHYLEQEYRTKLFLFSGKKMKMTEAGRFLLNRFITMKHDENHMKERFLLGFGTREKLRWGATLTVGEFMMPKRIASYLRRHPETDMVMHVDNTAVLLERLDRGEIDFAIVEGYFKKSDYDHRVYGQENYIGVCGATHVFPTGGIGMQELFGETLITREVGSGTREILEKTLEGMNYSMHDFHHMVEVGNLNVIKELVQEDCGITFLYRAAVEKELNEGTLRCIPMDRPGLVHDITFIWRKGSMFGSYYEELFLELQKN